VDPRRFCSRALPGEIDVTCRAQAAAHALTADILKSAAHATAVLLSFEMHDSLIATAYPRDNTDGSQTALSPPFRFRVSGVSDLEQAFGNAVRGSMARHIDGTWWTDKTRQHVFTRAAWRFLRAPFHQDQIDEFIEYWLVCEFLSSRFRKGSVAMRIRDALAPHLRYESNSKRARLLKGLKLEHLETTRNEVVHGEAEAVEISDLKLLQSVAKELMRAELCLPYQHDELIEEALAQAAGT
jgi:hypothetical protein